MKRTAVFVDAGYLFAQGSALLSGQKQPRNALSLDADVIRSRLEDFALKKTGARLLRIYWYDGASGRPTAEQSRLAEMDDIKLRLGFLNNAGQQKGVDSLIVTDLVELARNGSLCDAVLMSGDEDVRVGVTLAQTFGVRVHLLGIEPARSSQSHQLRMEADTTTEWGSEIVNSFLTMDLRKEPSERATLSPSTNDPEQDLLAEAVSVYIAGLAPQKAHDAKVYLDSRPGYDLPSDIDRHLLPKCRDAIGRNLDVEEKKKVRKLAAASLRGHKG